MDADVHAGTHADSCVNIYADLTSKCTHIVTVSWLDQGETEFTDNVALSKKERK